MDLAVKLPPVALARLLGIHITAGTWAERAGGSHAAYAAPGYPPHIQQV